MVLRTPASRQDPWLLASNRAIQRALRIVTGVPIGAPLSRHHSERTGHAGAVIATTSSLFTPPSRFRNKSRSVNPIRVSVYRRNAHRDRLRHGAGLEPGGPVPRAAVQLVRQRRAQPDIHLLRAGGVHEGRAPGLAGDDPAEGTGPLQGALRGGHPDIEAAVVGPGVREGRDATGDLPDVAEQHAGRPAVEPVGAVDAHLDRYRLVADLAHAGPHVRQAAEPLLEAAVGVTDHAAVETGAGHDREVLAVQLAEVEPAAGTAQAGPHRLGQVRRDAEVAGEQVRGTGRQDRDRDVGAGERVDAVLYHSVPAPDEDQFSTGVAGPARLPGGFAALRYLVPQRLVVALFGEQPAQLGEAAAEGLPAMRDDRDPHGRVVPTDRQMESSVDTRCPRTSAGRSSPRCSRTPSRGASTTASCPRPPTGRWSRRRGPGW